MGRRTLLFKQGERSGFDKPALFVAYADQFSFAAEFSYVVLGARESHGGDARGEQGDARF